MAFIGRRFYVLILTTHFHLCSVRRIPVKNEATGRPWDETFMPVLAPATGGITRSVEFHTTWASAVACFRGYGCGRLSCGSRQKRTAPASFRFVTQPTSGCRRRTIQTMRLIDPAPNEVPFHLVELPTCRACRRKNRPAAQGRISHINHHNSNTYSL